MMNNNNQNKIKRAHFTAEEDERLKMLVAKYGEDKWSQISKEMNGRSTRQCRERWNNNLSPSIIKAKWTKEDDALLFKVISEIGLKWKVIEKFFPGRTSTNIKNRYNCLKRFDELYRDTISSLNASKQNKIQKIASPKETQPVTQGDNTVENFTVIPFEAPNNDDIFIQNEQDEFNDLYFGLDFSTEIFGDDQF